MMFGVFFQKSKNKTSSKLDPEVERIFAKLDRFLHDDSAQIAQLPSAFQQKILENPNCDIIPNASGSFGRAATSPIPVNGPLGEALYLSSLRINKRPIFFHRLGSRAEVDVFEIVSMDGLVWDILCMSPYYPRKSNNYPTGFAFEPKNYPFFGTTTRVQPFPHNLYDAVRNFSIRMIGVPMPNADIRITLTNTVFQPPEVHRQLVSEILRSRITVALSDADVEKQ